VTDIDIAAIRARQAEVQAKCVHEWVGSAGLAVRAVRFCHLCGRPLRRRWRTDRRSHAQAVERVKT
jgi:hypothetical protein